MPLFKALIPGLILTFVVSLIMGSNGSTGAWLEIHRISIQGQTLYWSWPMFFGSTAIAWGIFQIMD